MSLALVHRELLSEARRPAHYWLRIVPVCLGAMAIVGVAARDDLKGPALGATLFGLLNQVVFISVWMIVPLITADCISRERREGTLGLLFLTPLSSWGVVIGKVLAQAVQVLTVGGAMVPILALPILLGGVSWERVGTAAMLDAAAVLLALGCGLLASAFTRARAKALVLAGLLGLGAGDVVADGYARQICWEQYEALKPLNPGMWRDFSAFLRINYLYSPELGWGQAMLHRFLFAGIADSQGLLSWVPGAKATQTGLRSAAGALVGGVVGFGVAVLVAGWRLRRLRGGEERSELEGRLAEIFCVPVLWKDWLRRRMARALERNPIGWLQSYTWSARLTKWGWCLVIILVELVMVSDVTLRSLARGQMWLVAFVLLSLAFSAASSFRQERETGALELLLVTPLREEQVVHGRVRGIWGQFLPAVALIGLAMLFMRVELQEWYSRQRAPVSFVSAWWLCLGFLCLPVVGLYFATRAWSPIVTWLATFGFGFGVPFVASEWLGPVVGEVVGALWMCALALLLRARLVRNLRLRHFVLQPA